MNAIIEARKAIDSNLTMYSSPEYRRIITGLLQILDAQPKCIELIQAELQRARIKHPKWPHDDTIWAAGIVCEESGELMRAAVQHRGEGGTLEACDIEAIQTAATSIRFLERA